MNHKTVNPKNSLFGAGFESGRLRDAASDGGEIFRPVARQPGRTTAFLRVPGAYCTA